MKSNNLPTRPLLGVFTFLLSVSTTVAHADSLTVVLHSLDPLLSFRDGFCLTWSEDSSDNESAEIFGACMISDQGAWKQVSYEMTDEDVKGTRKFILTMDGSLTLAGPSREDIADILARWMTSTETRTTRTSAFGGSFGIARDAFSEKNGYYSHTTAAPSEVPPLRLVSMGPGSFLDEIFEGIKSLFRKKPKVVSAPEKMWDLIERSKEPIFCNKPGRLPGNIWPDAIPMGFEIVRNNTTGKFTADIKHWDILDPTSRNANHWDRVCIQEVTLEEALEWIKRKFPDQDLTKILPNAPEA